MLSGALSAAAGFPAPVVEVGSEAEDLTKGGGGSRFSSKATRAFSTCTSALEGEEDGL